LKVPNYVRKINFRRIAKKLSADAVSVVHRGTGSGSLQGKIIRVTFASRIRIFIFLTKWFIKNDFQGGKYKDYLPIPQKMANASNNEISLSSNGRPFS
jgi:hypothetical protein